MQDFAVQRNPTVFNTPSHGLETILETPYLIFSSLFEVLYLEFEFDLDTLRKTNPVFIKFYEMIKQSTKYVMSK